MILLKKKLNDNARTYHFANTSFLLAFAGSMVDGNGQEATQSVVASSPLRRVLLVQFGLLVGVTINISFLSSTFSLELSIAQFFTTRGGRGSRGCGCQS